MNTNDGQELFSDVPSTAWFAPYINYAALKGVITGFGNGYFRPGDNITRGSMAKIASGVADINK